VVVLIVLAALVILAVVVVAALGAGGGLSAERNDYAPLDLGPVSATDVALLRPPTGMWGYNMQVTDEAMERIAESIRERDVRIVALEQLVTDLSRDHAPLTPLTPLASPYEGARHRRGVIEAGAIQLDAIRSSGIEPRGIKQGAIEYANPGPGRPSFDYAGPEFARPSVDHPGPDAITKPDPLHPAFEETTIDELPAQSGEATTEAALPEGAGRPGPEAPEQSHD
jgi:hypothetical protein